VVLEVIEPGPYLNELRANGLVYCWKEDVSVFVFTLGPPHEASADLCGPKL
jgi:hypothetical protein